MDPFDDILGEAAVNRVRPGGKFQPKAKPRPRKETSASVPSATSSDTKEKTVTLPYTGAGPTQSIQPVVMSSLATLAEEFLKNNEDSFPGLPNMDDTTKSELVNLSQVVATSKDHVGSIDAVPLEVEVSDINAECHSSFRKSEIEANSVRLDVDPSAGVFPEPAVDNENKLTNVDDLSIVTSEIVGTTEPSKDNEGSFSDKRNVEVVKASSQLVTREDAGSKDALHAEVATGSNNGLHSSFGILSSEVDSMGFELDPFGDILPEATASNARAGCKFQPKTKPHRPIKGASRAVASALPSVIMEEPVTSATTVRDDDYSFVDNGSSGLVKPSQPIETNLLHAEYAVSEGRVDWHSNSADLLRENADINAELEYANDFLTQSTNSTVSAAIKSHHGNDGEGSLPHSEMRTLLASSNKDNEENFGILSFSFADSSALRVCDAAQPHTSTDNRTAQDPVTCMEAAFSNKDGEIQIDNGRLETEFQEAGVFSDMETLDVMAEANIASGQYTGKFQPKPKTKIGKEVPSASILHPEVESVMCSQVAQLVSSETGYMDEGSVSAFPAGFVHDNSITFGDFIPSGSTSEIPMNEEMINPAETSHSDGPLSEDIVHLEDVPEIPVEMGAKSRKGKASTASKLPRKCKESATVGEENEGGKSSRKLRKRVAFQLIDELEEESNEDGSYSAEVPSNSNVDEGKDNDDECRVESTSEKKRAPRKSKKPAAENGKPARKRKKANESSDQSTKEPPKKFSHSTRRKRRCVDKTLLETPEDEIDPQKLPIKDLILLAEYRERLASKEASTSTTPLTNLSSNGSFHEEASNNGEEQGRGSDDDLPIYEDQPSNVFLNYQSFMDKTPSTRWSKQDTELFYEAVRQFGTDFSMIQQLFPGRTRHQVKLKFKKEERQYPVRLSDALSSRSEDHSHFQLVIERLQKAASQAEEVSNKDDSVGVTAEEEDMEELMTQTNEEAAKSERDEELVVKDQEADFAKAGSPLKSEASDDIDDPYTWDDYESI